MDAQLMPDSFHQDDDSKQKRSSAILHSSEFNSKDYEYSDRFQPWDGRDANGIHTTSELIEAANSNPNIQIDARVLAVQNKQLGMRRMDRTEFLEACKSDRATSIFKESDNFGYMDNQGGSSLYGKESVPMLGGPFSKQLYYYDYIRMHNLAFYAYHHDPMARAIVQIIRDFTLGRGFRVDCDNPTALAIWRAFEEVNDIQTMFGNIADELSIYGEEMIWWLPNRATAIAYQVRPGQEPTRGLIPRVRMIDPSSVWEVVTYPEDITRVLYYQVVAPTQWQMYTGTDKGQPVSGSKFIYQQIPADQVQHFKINSVSNEKRGRSDLFPVLGYLKRLRDSVNYQLIALQKQAAWSIDTSIEGSSEDIAQYITDLQGQGSIANAGSEFVHSSKVARTYLSNSAGKGGQQEIFEWCMSMIAAGTGIPVQYFGTHLSGAQTRASALVATEPVAKRFQMRQGVYERMVQGMAKKLFAQFGIHNVQVEVTFPELIVQDRTAKLKDLALGEMQGWWSKERAAHIAAKEMSISEYDYQKEQKDMALETPTAVNPLTTPGLLSSEPTPQTALTSTDRKSLSDQNRNPSS